MATVSTISKTLHAMCLQYNYTAQCTVYINEAKSIIQQKNCGGLRKISQKDELFYNQPGD
jgi:hypothetical protein